MTKRFDGVSIGVLIVAAAAFTLGVLWVRSWSALGAPSYDIYGFFYPNQVYAWRCLRAGTGVLWNPYQDCGQPFFALSQVGLLYPVNLVFAVLDREPALLASTLLNLSVAGAGTLLLGRALGLGRAPALCAALAFQLGWVCAFLASWGPIHIASLAWLPVALWCTERLCEHASPQRAIALGVVLTLQLLPGFFQIGFFTYQLIALRIAWVCVVRRPVRPLRVLGWAAVGMTLPLVLGAVQLLPSIEVAQESLRGFRVPDDQIGAPFTWASLAEDVAAKIVVPGYAVVVLLALLALLPGGPASRWDSVAFFGLVAAGYLILSVGPGSLLYDLYERLPFGRAFRDAGRLLWVTNFAVAVLAGWGAETLLHAAGRFVRALRVAALIAGIALLAIVARDGLGPPDVLVAAALIGAAGLAGSARWHAGAVVLLPLTIGVACLVFGQPPAWLFGLRGGDLYEAHAPLFAAVRERLTAQDRVLIAGRNPDFALMPKSASLFHLPNIYDYETQAPRLYVDYFTYMRTGRRLRNIRDWYWIRGKLLTPTMQRRLFDVTAARYVIVDREKDTVEQSLRGGVRRLTDAGDVRVYENLQALPRARYVSRVVVTSDDDGLAQLAHSPLDPRQVAWVQHPPQSGFLGGQPGASGSAEIVTDEAERVVVRVRADQPGFLFLADQYFPGWSAEVNGAAREILRADHAFRLVEVPAGESTVTFVYRPLSVRVGALVSAATLLALGVFWIRSRRALAQGSHGPAVT